MSDKLYRYRLALSQAGLEEGANFFILDLANELLLGTFNDHSAERGQSQGGVGRFGYSTVNFLWRQLTVRQAKIIDDMILTSEQTEGLGNALLYCTVPDVASGGWIDTSARFARPNWSTLVAQQSFGLVYQNVPLVGNNAQIVADPSTVS